MASGMSCRPPGSPVLVTACGGSCVSVAPCAAMMESFCGLCTLPCFFLKIMSSSDYILSAFFLHLPSLPFFVTSPLSPLFLEGRTEGLVIRPALGTKYVPGPAFILSHSEILFPPHNNHVEMLPFQPYLRWGNWGTNRKWQSLDGDWQGSLVWG